jgi:hypothetical protein
MALMAMAQGESLSQPSPAARECATASTTETKTTLSHKAIQKRRGKISYLSDEEMKRLQAKSEGFLSAQPNGFPPIEEFLAWIFAVRADKPRKIPSESWVRQTYKKAGFDTGPTRAVINDHLRLQNPPVSPPLSST